MILSYGGPPGTCYKYKKAFRILCKNSEFHERAFGILCRTLRIFGILCKNSEFHERTFTILCKGLQNFMQGLNAILLYLRVPQTILAPFINYRNSPLDLPLLQSSQYMRGILKQNTNSINSKSNSFSNQDSKKVASLLCLKR